MYTCISGFVDQGESVEDALQREAAEEIGVQLTSIRLVKSQSWPIGRAGSCELMIGCEAVAACDGFQINPVEIEDARWFTREQAAAMLNGTHAEGLATPGR